MCNYKNKKKFRKTIKIGFGPSGLSIVVRVVHSVKPELVICILILSKHIYEAESN